MMDFKGPGFHLQVPTDWFISSSPQIQAMFVAPNAEEKIRPNFLITIRPLEMDVKLEEIVQIAKETQMKEYPQYEVLEEGKLDKDPGGFYRSYEWKQEMRQVKIIQRQIMFINNSMLYTITTTRSEMTEAQKIDLLFDHMINSFHFD